jgi:hypothetical protein
LFSTLWTVHNLTKNTNGWCNPFDTDR